MHRAQRTETKKHSNMLETLGFACFNFSYLLAAVCAQ